MKIVLRSFLPGILAFIVATVLFCLPGKEFPTEDWFEKIFLDKWIHVGLFASLVALWCLPFIPNNKGTPNTRNIFIRIALLFVSYGVAIEFIQGRFIPFRSFDIGDMVADALGCGVGFLFSEWQLKKY